MKWSASETDAIYCPVRNASLVSAYAVAEVASLGATVMVAGSLPSPDSAAGCDVALGADTKDLLTYV